MGLRESATHTIVRRISAVDDSWDEFKQGIKPLTKKERILKESLKINKQQIAESVFTKTINRPPEKLPHVDVQFVRELQVKRIQNKIDLHGLNCEQAEERLFQFFKKAQLLGLKAVLVITGKGSSVDGFGVLRNFTIQWFKTHSEFVVAYAEADDKDGGQGAFYVHVRKSH